MLVCSETYADKHGLQPLAAHQAVAVAGCAPEIMGIGPVAATQKALARAAIEIEAIDVVELNEAFASQALACVRELAFATKRSTSMAAPSRSAIRSAPPAPASPARRRRLLARTGNRYALATPMHRRRPGHRHHSGARVMAGAIRKVSVIGAGVMGAGIAAQVANAGVPVVLLDIVPAGATNRNVLAEDASGQDAEDRTRRHSCTTVPLN